MIRNGKKSLESAFHPSLHTNRLDVIEAGSRNGMSLWNVDACLFDLMSNHRLIELKEREWDSFWDHIKWEILDVDIGHLKKQRSSILNDEYRGCFTINLLGYFIASLTSALICCKNSVLVQQKNMTRIYCQKHPAQSSESPCNLLRFCLLFSLQPNFVWIELQLLNYYQHSTWKELLHHVYKFQANSIISSHP